MAKRKRLSPALATSLPDLETDFGTKPALGGVPRARAPIADVAAGAATEAALTDLADEIAASRREGRLAVALPTAAIDAAYLVRDRVALDEDELQTLMTSLSERGQQVPLEVVDLGEGRYGLISGWRRLTALRRLHEETGEDRFATALAVLRQPAEAGEAYRAMVEENEIRSSLSFYERARIAVLAVERGAFAEIEEAVSKLFSAVSRAKRSKVRSFVALYEHLDPYLAFPTAIPERVGLALAQAMAREPRLAGHLAVALGEAGAATAEEERKVIDRVLSLKDPVRQSVREAKALRDETVVPGLRLKTGRERLTLTGPAVDDELRSALVAWLSEQLAYRTDRRD